MLCVSLSYLARTFDHKIERLLVYFVIEAHETTAWRQMGKGNV